MISDDFFRKDMDLKEEPVSPLGLKHTFSSSSSTGSLYVPQPSNASGSSSGHGLFSYFLINLIFTLGKLQPHGILRWISLSLGK